LPAKVLKSHSPLHLISLHPEDQVVTKVGGLTF
jgi:hypothetical protein